MSSISSHSSDLDEEPDDEKEVTAIVSIHGSNEKCLVEYKDFTRSWEDMEDVPLWLRLAYENAMVRKSDDQGMFGM